MVTDVNVRGAPRTGVFMYVFSPVTQTEKSQYGRSSVIIRMAIAKEVFRSLKIASVVLEIFDVKNVYDELPK